jgi:hypothetical protein
VITSYPCALSRGPTIFGRDIAAKVIDELFLTVAPQIAGRQTVTQLPSIAGAASEGSRLKLTVVRSQGRSGPTAADQIRPHIVRDRAVRAWLGEDGGRATLAARLNSCSQPSAELFVLLLETGQSLHTAFFNDKISL